MYSQQLSTVPYQRQALTATFYRTIPTPCFSSHAFREVWVHRRRRLRTVWVHRRRRLRTVSMTLQSRREEPHSALIHSVWRAQWGVVQRAANHQKIILHTEGYKFLLVVLFFALDVFLCTCVCQCKRWQSESFVGYTGNSGRLYRQLYTGGAARVRGPMAADLVSTASYLTSSSS